MCSVSQAQHASRRPPQFHWDSNAVAMQDVSSERRRTAAAVALPALGAVAYWATVAAWGLLEVPIWVDVPTVHTCTPAHSSSTVNRLGKPLLEGCQMNIGWRGEGPYGADCTYRCSTEVLLLHQHLHPSCQIQRKPEA
jgi:hypothetical protein